MEYIDIFISFVLFLKKHQDEYPINSSCTFECFELGSIEDEKEGYEYAVKLYGMGDPVVFIFKDSKWQKGRMVDIV